MPSIVAGIQHRWPLAVQRMMAICAVFITALTASSCSFGDDEDIVALKGIDQQYLYVAGRSNGFAAVWLVGNRGTVKLSLPGPSGTTASEAMGCVVSDGRLYVSGWVQNGAAADPCIWVNGAIMVLDDQGSMIAPNGYGIDVKNGLVAVTGQTGGSNKACYWLDGVVNLLPEPPWANFNSRATSVRFGDAGVIVGGFTSSGPNFQAGYWVDGQFMPLGPLAQSTITGIDIYEGMIYGAGVSSTGNEISYWVSGAQVPVASIVPSPGTGSIRVYNGVPYVAGWYQQGGFSNAMVWVGNSAGRIVLSTVQSYAKALVLTESYASFPNALIVAGGYQDASSTACLWVNGLLVKLDSGGAFPFTIANDICTGPPLW